jgi:DNA modification methylase
MTPTSTLSPPKPYYQDDAVTIYHGDCREIVPTLGKFDLLLTDPPYGIGADNQARILSRVKLARPKDYGGSNWDTKPPKPWVLQMLIDHARNAIIWGGNYFELPPCNGPLVWDKENTGDFADGEQAWNNLGCALRIKRHLWNGMIRKGNEDRFHPTQKPVEVMLWCISLAGDEAQTILDPFAGSGTTGRAAKDLGRKATLIELEERYCEIAAKRMAQEVLPL